MLARLFRAYVTDGLNIVDHDVLADVREAQELGITGVPFFVFDGTLTVSGAQPVDAFRQALERAWTGKFAPSA